MPDVDVTKVMADAGSPAEVAAKPVKEKKPAKPKYTGPACSVCGKPLTDPKSVEAGIGPLCRAKGWTKETVAAKMTILMRKEVPAGWVKLADVAKMCEASTVPVARLVRAVGGDRGMEIPANEKWQVVYVGRTRYLDPFCLTPEAMIFLGDKLLGKPAKVKKVAEPKAPASVDAKPASAPVAPVVVTVAKKPDIASLFTKK